MIVCSICRHLELPTSVQCSICKSLLALDAPPSLSVATRKRRLDDDVTATTTDSAAAPLSPLRKSPRRALPLSTAKLPADVAAAIAHYARAYKRSFTDSKLEFHGAAHLVDDAHKSLRKLLTSDKQRVSVRELETVAAVLLRGIGERRLVVAGVLSSAASARCVRATRRDGTSARHGAPTGRRQQRRARARPPRQPERGAVPLVCDDATRVSARLRPVRRRREAGARERDRVVCGARAQVRPRLGRHRGRDSGRHLEPRLAPV